MTCNYLEIQRDNIIRYGTDIGRIGRILLADRYDERTHFIFELLQNAEDALARLREPPRSRAVSFHLDDHSLRVGHYGMPFDGDDVRGVCGIDESTKKINEIGRFGIGFKSVYALADRPEIHSGTESFAIEEYVRPIAAPDIARDADETAVLIPFRPSAHSAYHEIHDGLRRIGASGLLFLSQIEEISWRAESGATGQYLRESTHIDVNVRQVTIIGEQDGQTVADEEWLVFSREMTADDGSPVRPVEIAFRQSEDQEAGARRIHRVEQSPLVVFFPTAVETHLGFLVQGPYRTTPSRDNIPRDDEWNKTLVQHTAALLRRSLCWLRDHRLLDTEVLRCLPLDPGKFGDRSLFAPLFSGTKEALSAELLLPRYDSGYAAAPDARLGRTRELRGLFDASQLTAIYGEGQQVAWLLGSITQDRTPELRDYLMRELNVPETTPEDIVRRLDNAFLEAQSDEWIQKLYEFLNSQTALRRFLSALPLVRLEDGSHVLPAIDGQLSAFLPTGEKTGFPTVRRAVCQSKLAREFLRLLGLKEPDPVDDVVVNILPRYSGSTIDIDDRQYESDIARILTAFGTDSQAQRDKLVDALSKTRFVRSIDASDRSFHYAEPSRVYLATDRLTALLEGVKDVLFVDDSHACLRGENMRSLLEASGATRSLQPVEVRTAFTEQQERTMRVQAGCEDSTGGELIQDTTLRGLDGLLTLLPELDRAARSARVNLLWEALEDLETRRGKGTFSGKYFWRYHYRRSASFDAAFVRKLNTTRWIPDTNGDLRLPEFVPFGSLGWNSHPFLESMIHFEPPELEDLARKLGIDPGMIELLREAGIDTEEELRQRLGLRKKPPSQSDPMANKTDDTSDIAPQTDRSRGSGQEHSPGSREANTDAENRSRAAGSGAARFVSYVAVHTEEEQSDSDGLSHERRMALEERAIRLILKCEPQWQRTASNNPGFDLFRTDGRGQQTFCEVKAMTGTLQDRPVGLSRTQFNHAYRHGRAFWLYIVEHANTDDAARIVRIQNPAREAQTFTYDGGWLAMDANHESQDHDDSAGK